MIYGIGGINITSDPMYNLKLHTVRLHTVLFVLTFLCLVNFTPTTSFLLPPSLHPTFTLSPLHGFFDKAFANENLGDRPNAGLKNGPKVNDKVTINGKDCKNAVVGQKLAIVANQARVKISYNCQQGDCGTCMVKVNGRKVKACQAIVPGGACKIETL